MEKMGFKSGMKRR